MVAVTVVLSAVIAGFVMEMGDGMEDSLEATGAASFDFDADEGAMTVSIVSEGNADEWEVVGDIDGAVGIDGAGDTVTLTCADELDSDGTVSVTASIDGGSSTVIGSGEYDCSDADGD